MIVIEAIAGTVSGWNAGSGWMMARSTRPTATVARVATMATIAPGTEEPADGGSSDAEA